MIRPFEEQDTEGILELILHIQQNEFGVPLTRADQPDLERISSYYQQGFGNFWVALENTHEGEGKDQKVVGTIALIDFAPRLGCIRKMFVQADHRGEPHRLGQRLLETLLEWSKAHALEGLYLGTHSILKGSHRFYEKNGFAAVDPSSLPETFPRMAVDDRFYHLNMLRLK
jgi:N-acetylglutamate synthase-like GNAT family acetyltransferase